MPRIYRKVAGKMIMASTPRLGSESFWEMSALAIAGQLASCQSCVEYWYFQSQQNSIAFLESAVAAGLVEKVRLSDFGAEVTVWPRRHSGQRVIYISAPAFRIQNLDAARGRIEKAKNVVYNAFHFYFDILGGDDDVIAAAYENAVAGGKLRHSEIARQRVDVDLSPVAKMRLIQDGFSCEAKRESADMSEAHFHELVINRTSKYILGFADASLKRHSFSEHAEELDTFVTQFVAGSRTLEEFWRSDYGALPTDWRTLLLPMIDELVKYRARLLSEHEGEEISRRFLDSMRESAEAAIGVTYTPVYSNALREFVEDLQGISSGVDADRISIPPAPRMSNAEVSGT